MQPLAATKSFQHHLLQYPVHPNSQIHILADTKIGRSFCNSHVKCRLSFKQREETFSLQRALIDKNNVTAQGKMIS